MDMKLDGGDGDKHGTELRHHNVWLFESMQYKKRYVITGLG